MRCDEFFSEMSSHHVKSGISYQVSWSPVEAVRLSAKYDEADGPMWSVALPARVLITLAKELAEAIGGE